MYKWVVRTRKGLRMLYEFFFIIMIMNCTLCLSEKSMLNKKGLLVLGGLLIVSYITRDYLSHAIFLIIAHGILAVLSYFIMNDVYMGVVMILVTTGIFIDAAMYMKRGFVIVRAFEFPGDVIFLGILCAIVGAYLRIPKLTMIGYISSVIMLAIYLLSIYLEGMASYMEMNRRVKGMPVKQLVSVNSFIVTTVVAIIVVTIFMADILGLPEVVKGFFLALLGILKILFIVFSVVISLFSGLFGGTVIPPEIARKEIEQVAQEESIFGRIVYFILVALLIIAAMYVLIKICSFIVRWLISKQERSNEMTEDLDTIKKRRPVKTKIEKEEGTGVLSIEQKARRIYKKRVLSYRRYFLPDSSDTTSDIEEAMIKTIRDQEKKEQEAKETYTEEILVEQQRNSLKELYDAVRYGNAKIDKEYLAEMKKVK